MHMLVQTISQCKPQAKTVVLSNNVCLPQKQLHSQIHTSVYSFLVCIYSIKMHLFYKSLSVGVRKTAGRNSCLIVSGDVSNCSYRLKAHNCQEFTSQSGLDIFYTQKHPKLSRIRFAYATVYLNEAPTGHSSPAEPAKRVH